MNPQGSRKSGKPRVVADTAPALSGGLAILERLAEQPAGLRFTDVVAHERLSRSSVTRILKLLLARGYVVKDEASQHYYSGLKSALLHRHGAHWAYYLKKAEALIKAVAAEAGNTCILFLREGSVLTSVFKEVMAQSIVMQTVGERNGPETAAPWCALLAEEQGLPLLASYSSLSVQVSGEVIHSWREFYRRHRYVCDDAAVIPAVRRLAVPIKLESGDLIGALGAGGTTFSLPEALQEETAERLWATSRQLGSLYTEIFTPAQEG